VRLGQSLVALAEVGLAERPSASARALDLWARPPHPPS